MVLSATATIGDETVPGVIDNSGHTVQFVFNENSDFSNVDITIEYADRAILKEGAETAFTADLTEGYSFVVNNLEEDYTYTVTATRASVIQIDRLQCSVVTGLAGTLGIEPTLLYFGLLSGATLGGNCTPIGASANIAGIGILRKADKLRKLANTSTDKPICSYKHLQKCSGKPF